MLRHLLLNLILRLSWQDRHFRTYVYLNMFFPLMWIVLSLSSSQHFTYTLCRVWVYCNTTVMYYFQYIWFFLFYFLAKCSEFARQPIPKKLLDIIGGTNKVRSGEEYWGQYRVFQKEVSILGGHCEKNTGCFRRKCLF